MARDICDRFGVALEVVPTGFRFISERIAECERTGDKRFLFGFEESYGFLAGTVSRDKDAICAAMLLAEACQYYDSRNMSLASVLNGLYESYGWHMERTKSYTLAGKEGVERIAGAMERLREAPPRELFGLTVTQVIDMRRGVCTFVQSGEQTAYRLSGLNVMQFELPDAWLCARPSGTEPKLKLYMGVKADSEAAAKALLLGLSERADELLSGYLGL